MPVKSRFCFPQEIPQFLVVSFHDVYLMVLVTVSQFVFQCFI